MAVLQFLQIYDKVVNKRVSMLMSSLDKSYILEHR